MTEHKTAGGVYQVADRITPARANLHGWVTWARCDTCGIGGPADGHPCRFEAGCTCWYGVECSTAAEMRRGRATDG